MKIGIFTYGIYGERMTGIARYTVELTRALLRIDPTLAITLLNPYPESKHPWYREFPVHPLPHLKKLPLVATLGNLELHLAATRLRLDVLHDPCGIAPFLAPRGSYRRVTTIHDAVPAVYPGTQPLLTRLVFATLVARAGITSDAILTVSRASASDLIRYYRLPPAKIHVTPNGVLQRPALSQEYVCETLKRFNVREPFLLYVGALHPRKNIRRVIEAFARLRKTHPRAALVIVGPPAWGANEVLRDVLSSAAAGSGVIFTGFLSDNDLQALYQGALCLVFPSLYEGFGLPVLEAMSHGTPVITSNISSLPEITEDAALLVDPASVDSICNGMRRLLEDKTLCNELSCKGRARSKKFSWEATATATLGIYHNLVDHSSGQG